MEIILSAAETVLLLDNPLFYGFNEKTLLSALRCLKAERRSEGRDRALYPYGERAIRAAVVLEGIVDVSLYSPEGHHLLVSRMREGELIAESLVCNGSVNNSLDFRTAKDSTLLYLELPSKSNRKQSDCPYYSMILQNLICELAEKTVMLNKKVLILGQRTLREKLMCHFEDLSFAQNSRSVTLGYSRETLASIVSADRSAVSRELGRMKRDGLIRVERDRVELLGEAVSAAAL